MKPCTQKEIDIYLQRQELTEAINDILDNSSNKWFYETVVKVLGEDDIDVKALKELIK